MELPGSIPNLLSFENFIKSEPDPTASPTKQLLDEVDRLMHQHRIEMEAYLMEWCQRHETKFEPLPSPASSSLLLPVAPRSGSESEHNTPTPSSIVQGAPLPVAHERSSSKSSKSSSRMGLVEVFRIAKSNSPASSSLDLLGDEISGSRGGSKPGSPKPGSPRPRVSAAAAGEDGKKEGEGPQQAELQPPRVVWEDEKDKDEGPQAEVHPKSSNDVRAISNAASAFTRSVSLKAVVSPRAKNGTVSFGVVPTGSDQPSAPDSGIGSPSAPSKKSIKNMVQKTMLARRTSSKVGGRKSNTQMISDARRLELMAQQTIVQKITSSKTWEVFSVGLILLNSMFIGLTTEYLAQRAQSEARDNKKLSMGEPEAFFVCQVLFTILFTFELTMRWVSDGFFEFWKGGDIGWNALDTTVVLFGIVDLISTMASDANSGGSFTVIRVIRVVRVVRVARVIRVMKFFRELRMMVLSIMSSFKNLTWVILVLGMLFYVFAISFTAAVSDFLESSEMRNDPANKELIDAFGTLDKSILSLYMCMSGGDDWSACYNALQVLPGLYSFLFLGFITFALFAVVNIVTGVFVESAMQSSQADRDSIVQDEIAAQKNYLKAMETLFQEIDDDNSGHITLEEFQGRLDDPRVAAYFNSLKLDVSDAPMLFRLLDEDNSNEVTCEEFVAGCQRLQGESRSLDAKIMQHEVRSLKKSMDSLLQEIFRGDAGKLQDIQKESDSRSDSKGSNSKDSGQKPA